jgi:hypothetical protein
MKGWCGDGLLPQAGNYHTPVGKPVAVVHARLQRAATETALGLSARR